MTFGKVESGLPLLSVICAFVEGSRICLPTAWWPGVTGYGGRIVCDAAPR